MKPGRNDPCPCGSGKKFKKCCQDTFEANLASARAPAKILHPTQAEINQIVAIFNTRDYVELEKQAHLLVEMYPDSGFAWKVLGTALWGQGKEALPALHKATVLLPTDSEAHNNLGLALKNLGQFTEALASYRRALEINPQFSEAHNNLGLVLKYLGKSEEALASYRRAVEINPNFFEAHNNFGVALQDLGLYSEAVASHRRAIEVNPGYVDAYYNLGVALIELGQFDESVRSYRRALEIDPNSAKVHSLLGNALRDLGQLDDALTCYHRAIEIKPDIFEAHNNLLFVLNFVATHTPAYCLEQARQFGRIATEKVGARFTEWRCDTQPKKLRVGFVSGDLLSHPVGFFLEGLLSHINPDRIELFAYSARFKEDELTARIRPYFSSWKSLVGLSDEAAARVMHDDGIHLLLDISGHTNLNRLPAFAWKPAPVQVSWLGYFATTGIAEIDYLLADEVGVPKALQNQFTESIWYLPDTRLCFTAPRITLPVTATPALTHGWVTFGCFQNLSKVTDEVLACWAKILTALPKAKLRIQSAQLGESSRQEQMLQRLQRYGIPPENVELLSAANYENYLAAHAEVDIILDTFPYPGGTTTCEALWMGVPTLTLAGDRLLARQGASLLTAVGLEEWIATSQDGYVAKAIALASDLPKLETLRMGLRQQVLDSPLFNAARFARNFEDALWGMWTKYLQ